MGYYGNKQQNPKIRNHGSNLDPVPDTPTGELSRTQRSQLTWSYRPLFNGCLVLEQDRGGRMRTRDLNISELSQSPVSLGRPQQILEINILQS